MWIIMPKIFMNIIIITLNSYNVTVISNTEVNNIIYYSYDIHVILSGVDM
jgi:hypothetical protein